MASHTCHLGGLLGGFAAAWNTRGLESIPEGCTDNRLFFRIISFLEKFKTENPPEIQEERPKTDKDGWPTV